jgi:hypothetical protein
VQTTSQEFSILPAAGGIAQPAKNDRWFQGATSSIVWNSCSTGDSAGTVVIYQYCTVCISYPTFGSAIAVSGSSYNYAVPSSMPPGSYYAEVTLSPSGTVLQSQWFTVEAGKQLRLQSCAGATDLLPMRIVSPSTGSAPLAPTSIIITKPNKQVIWRQGSNVAVTWVVDNNLGDAFLIELWSAGTNIFGYDTRERTIATAASNSGSKSWIVDTTLTPGSSYYVYLVSASSPATFQSNLFEIQGVGLHASEPR